MAKKLFLFIALLCSVQLIHSQSMSDEQVMEYILSEKNKGTNEKTIAQNLLSRGVSPAQLREIQRKYQEEKGRIGAVNITNSDRTREAAHGSNEYFQEVYNRYETSAEKQVLIQKELAFLDIDSIAHYNSLLKSQDNNSVYGRELFNNKLLTFQPAMNIPTPADYILGPGDQVIIDIWGASQKSINGKISPEGSIVIEGAGPVKLAGLTVSEANDRVKEMMNEFYGGSSVALSLGGFRSVKVEIVGDVVAPGSYTLSAFSTIFNALYMAGGISELGTLRNIVLYRNGKKVSQIDVYDYIINGNNTGNVRLQDNDLIIVGPYDAIVNIQGKTKRPMKYEIKKEETLANLLSYSGGFTGDAYTKNVRVIRKSGKEYSIHTIIKEKLGSFHLEDGDSVYIDSIIPRFSNMVEIKGAVFHPGMYELGEDINTVMDLIDAADGLREDAFLNRAVMHRRKPDMTLFAKSVDINGIINGNIPDIKLEKEDVLFIPSTTEMRGEETVTITGEVLYPGTYEYAENTTIEDFILQAGGLKNTASTTKIDVSRRIYDLKASEEPDTLIERFYFELKDGFIIDGEEQFTLEPFDEVHVRKSPASSKIKNVTITGAVNFEGKYAITNRNYRVSDLIKDAGGLTSFAQTDGARLYRRTTNNERIQHSIAIRNAKAQSYQERLRFDSNYDMVIADSLTMTRLREGRNYTIAINLEKIMKNPGGEDDIILNENDELFVPETQHTIKVTGEVNQPISIKYKKGEKLGYYIKQAGGYTDMAKEKEIYSIHMNGSVSKLSKNSRKGITPGCEIVVPAKRVSKKMSTAEVVSITSVTATLATMIVTLVSVLK